MRIRATTEAFKDLFKLMNNSVFGKTIQNIMKYRNIYLCEQWETIDNRKGANSLLASGYMKKYKIFNENLIAVELARKCLTFDKPIIIGFSVLELSKHHLQFSLWCNETKIFGRRENCTLLQCYMDTDSFIYQIKTEDWYEDMKWRPSLIVSIPPQMSEWSIHRTISSTIRMLYDQKLKRLSVQWRIKRQENQSKSFVDWEQKHMYMMSMIKWIKRKVA